MMDFVSDLMEIAGESSFPDKQSIDWASLEKSMGVVLPGDYKELLSKYRSAKFGPIWLITPRSGIPGASDPLAATIEWREIFEEIHGDEPGGLPRPCRPNGEPLGDRPSAFQFFPDTPGLLAWGRDEMGGEYYWYVEGPPNTWTVVAHAAKEEWWDEHPMTMSEYLYGIVTGRLDCDVAPRGFEGEGIFQEM